MDQAWPGQVNLQTQVQKQLQEEMQPLGEGWTQRPESNFSSVEVNVLEALYYPKSQGPTPSPFCHDTHQSQLRGMARPVLLRSLGYHHPPPAHHSHSQFQAIQRTEGSNETAHE